MSHPAFLKALPKAAFCARQRSQTQQSNPRQRQVILFLCIGLETTEKRAFKGLLERPNPLRENTRLYIMSKLQQTYPIHVPTFILKAQRNNLDVCCSEGDKPITDKPAGPLVCPAGNRGSGGECSCDSVPGWDGSVKDGGSWDGPWCFQGACYAGQVKLSNL